MIESRRDGRRLHNLFEVAAFDRELCQVNSTSPKKETHRFAITSTSENGFN